MSHTIILDPGQHEISLKKAVRLRSPEPIMNSIVLWILFQGTLFEFQLGEGRIRRPTSVRTQITTTS